MVGLETSITISHNCEILLITVDQNQILIPSQILNDVLDNRPMISTSHVECIRHVWACT
jgi:hypothetical protein